MPGPELYLALLGVLVLVMVAMAALNVLIERLAYRPLRRAPRLAPLISAIGVSFILINIGLLWKGRPAELPQLHPPGGHPQRGLQAQYRHLLHHQGHSS